MNSVRDFIQKIKSWKKVLNSRDDIFIALIIILVGAGSFGLGRLSITEKSRQGIVIENIGVYSNEKSQEKLKNLSNMIILGDEKYVASVKGAKYHAPWCGGAKRIKEENKIWFSSVEDAREAGYTPAKNCKGLK